MPELNVSVKRLPNLRELPLPSYATCGSAGMDLYAAIDEDIILKPMQRHAVPTGIAIALPFGYEAQIRPRSGLALRHGISMPNSPGTIDADYRGEVSVLLVNLGSEDFVISRGMRMAQMIVAPHSKVAWSITEILSETTRGEDGFGSTGVKGERGAA